MTKKSKKNTHTSRITIVRVRYIGKLHLKSRKTHIR